MTIDACKSQLYRRNDLLVLEAAGWRCEWPGCGKATNTADHITSF
jgi:hypothetical protein